MRSRYVVYTRNNIDYIARTMRGPAIQYFDTASAKKWAGNIKWLGLTVQEAQDTIVEFTAHYEQDNQRYTLHKLSLFEYIDSTWFYLDSLL